jgi:hypothetical protein
MVSSSREGGIHFKGFRIYEGPKIGCENVTEVGIIEKKVNRTKFKFRYLVKGSLFSRQGRSFFSSDKCHHTKSDRRHAHSASADW